MIPRGSLPFCDSLIIVDPFQLKSILFYSILFYSILFYSILFYSICSSVGQTLDNQHQCKAIGNVCKNNLHKTTFYSIRTLILNV